MQRLFGFLIAAAIALGPIGSESGFAQDDWGVKRDPFDRKIIARYKRILERNPGDESARRKLVQLYKRYRTVDLLVREYEQQLHKHARDFSSAVVLGHLYLSRGASDKALEYFQRAARLKPGDPSVQLALGDLHRQAGDLPGARTAYEAALDTAGSNKAKRPILRALAELALGSDDIEGADRYYNEYFALAPKDVQARIEFGDALIQHGKHEQAVAVFKGAEARLRSDPARMVEVITRMGTAYEAAGKDDAAIREYRRAMDKVGRSYYLRKELIARIIDIHRKRQALGDLVTLYENKWPKNRRKHFEWDTLGRLYEETGDHEKAIQAFRQATRKAPYELDTQRRLIALLENSGREDEALAQYEVVIRVAPGEPRFQLELAERYWRRGQDKQALSLLSKMERRFPGDAGVHAAIADLYTRWGKADLALAAYKRLTQIEPGDITHLVNLGEQYFQRNHKKQADAIWRRIIAHKTPENYARLGEVYAEHDMLRQALDMYARAIKLQPKNPDHYKGRARVFERQRTYPRAIEDWEKVLELTPKKSVNRPARREARRRVVGLLKRGRSRMLRTRTSRWRSAFASTPPDQDAGYFLVEVYLRDHDYPRAREVLVKLLKIDRGDVEAMEQLVDVYKRERNYDGAVDLLTQLAEKVPGRKREFYSEIAEIKTDQRKDDEAIEWINKAVQSSPKDPVAHQRLAERYAAMQQFDQAIHAYERTLELDRRNFRAYFALAQLYVYVEHNPEKAAELYREVLRRATDEELLRKAGRQAIALEELTQTLGELERTLVPLAFTFSHKPVYRQILVELYGRYVPSLVDRWRKHDDDAARAELTRLGTHGLKPLLEALSDDDDSTQQKIAVDVLGYLGNKGAAAPLIRLAQKTASADHRLRRGMIGTLRPTPEWNVRVSALIAAGRLGDSRMIDALRELSSHREKTMREAALFALGRTGHADAIPALSSALTKEGDSLQTLACLGLAHIRATREQPRALQALEQVVSNRRNADYSRAACAFALGYLESRKSVPTLIDALGHGNDETQRMAAWALGRMGVKQAVPTLIGAYFSRHPDVRDMVGWALARAVAGTPDTTPVPELEFDTYGSLGIRYDAAAAIRELPGRSAASDDHWPSPDIILGQRKQLTRGLQAALSRHRDLLVQVLGELDEPGDHLGLGALTRGIDNLPAKRRARVAAALGAMAKEIAPRLVELTGHRDAKVRALALSVLSKIDVPASQQALIAGMDDPVHSVWSTAMRACATHARLYRSHAPDLARAVSDRLSSDAWEIRSTAADVLGTMGKHADKNALRALLSDSHTFVRARAARALGLLGDRDSVELLIAATGDSARNVVIEAMRSLKAIGDERSLAHLRILARESRDPDLAKIAHELLEPAKN